MTASEIIMTCWVIFFVVWIVNAARKRRRTVEQQSARRRLAHRIPLGLAWWLLIVPKWRPAI